MDVKLVMAKGRPREHTIQLRSDETVIGRHRECNLRVPSSDVSRRHCVLRYQDGFLYVEDLGSTNGTLINGEPIKGSRLIRPGDELGVGPVTFTVEYRLPARAPAPRAAAPDPEVEVIDEGEEEAVIVIDDAEDGDLFNIEAEATKSKLPSPSDTKREPAKAKPDKPAKAQPEEPADVQFDLDDQPLQLPDGGDLRDILSRLDK